MNVGCGVNVGSGTFSSMVGGWSPMMGGSVVGSVENMPAGAVGEDTGPSLPSPQAIRASRTAAMATSPE